MPAFGFLSTWFALAGESIVQQAAAMGYPSTLYTPMPISLVVTVQRPCIPVWGFVLMGTALVLCCGEIPMPKLHHHSFSAFEQAPVVRSASHSKKHVAFWGCTFQGKWLVPVSGRYGCRK